MEGYRAENGTAVRRSAGRPGVAAPTAGVAGSSAVASGVGCDRRTSTRVRILVYSSPAFRIHLLNCFFVFHQHARSQVDDSFKYPAARVPTYIYMIYIYMIYIYIPGEHE